MSRLWYWDYSPEVFIKVMDEYSYGILATQKGGMAFRIKLISTLFADVMQLNAAEPEKPPLDYTEVKNMWVDMLSINEVPHCRPYQCAASGELQTTSPAPGAPPKPPPVQPCQPRQPKQPKGGAKQDKVGKYPCKFYQIFKNLCPNKNAIFSQKVI